MIVSFARAGAWLLVQAAQFPDTVLMRQVGQEQSLFQKTTAIASGLMTIALLVLTVALVPAAWNFRKSYAKVSDLLDRVYGDINPLMRHASAIADRTMARPNDEAGGSSKAKLSMGLTNATAKTS